MESLNAISILSLKFFFPAALVFATPCEIYERGNERTMHK